MLFSKNKQCKHLLFALFAFRKQHSKKKCIIIWKLNWGNGEHRGWNEVRSTARKLFLGREKETWRYKEDYYQELKALESIYSK